MSYLYIPRAKLSKSNECGVIRLSHWWRSYKRYKCGHNDVRLFKLVVFGVERTFLEQNGKCPECYLKYIKEKTIRCAVCSLPIFPGSQVALYPHESIPEENLDTATFVDGKYAIGCLSWKCKASAPSHFSGHWTENGFKPLYSQKGD